VTTQQRLITAEEHSREPAWERRELLNGVLQREMAAPNYDHGSTGTSLGFALESYARARNAGTVLIEVGHTLRTGPDTVRIPDVSFLARGREPVPPHTSGYPRLALDLAIRVISPNDRAGDVRAKV
jgi:Uma2 family endonuclease